MKISDCRSVVSTTALLVFVVVLTTLAAQAGPQPVVAVPLALPIPASVPAPVESMLSRGGSLVLKVRAYDGARLAVLDAARREGAQVLDARTYVNPKGSKHGYVRMRVAAARFAALRGELLPIGTLYSESVQSSDVISDYNALALRIEKLKEHEGRLENLLNGNRRMRGNDILFLQERLYNANTNEVDLIQQRGDLLRSSQASVISVALFEPGAMPVGVVGPVSPAAWFTASAAIARAGFNHQLDRAATAAAYGKIWAPVWIPVALTALAILWCLWMIRRRIVSAIVSGANAVFIATRRAIAWSRTVEITPARNPDERPNLPT